MLSRTRITAPRDAIVISGSRSFHKRTVAVVWFLVLGSLMMSRGLSSAQAREWIVAQANAAASDDNPGTPDKPLKSINAAAAQAMPGDVVRVHAGVYRERVNPARSGEVGKPIVYEAAAGQKVYVRGSEIFAPQWGGLGDAAGVYEGSLENVKFGLDAYGGLADPTLYGDFNPYLRNFNRDRVARPTESVVQEIQEAIAKLEKEVAEAQQANLPSLKGRQDKLSAAKQQLADVQNPDESKRLYRLTMGQIIVRGVPMRQVESLSQLELIPGTWMVSPDGKSIWLHTPDNQSPGLDDVEITTRHAVFSPLRRGLSHITVRGFVFEHAAGFFPIWWSKQWPQAGMVSCRSGTKWVIENNEIRYAGGIGMDIGQEGHPTSVEFVKDIEGGQKEKWQFIAGHTIANNHIHDNGFAGINGWWATECRITGNLIERNNSDGWPASPWYENAGIKLHQSRDTVIEGNLIRDNDCYGIWLDAMFPNARITRNVIVNNAWAGVFMEFGTTAMIDNNVIAYTRSGDGVYGHDANSVTVAHNLLYNNSNYGVYFAYAVPRNTHAGKTAGCYDNQVINNLVIGNRAGAISLPHDWDLAKNNRSDFNLIMGAGQFLDASRPVQDSPIFVVNSDAHMGPSTRMPLTKVSMTRELLFKELTQAMEKAGLDEAQRPTQATFLKFPGLTFDQWQAATGNDQHSAIEAVVASKYDFSRTKLEWYFAFTEALNGVKCSPVSGVQADFYGNVVGPNPLPGPFQSLQTGENRLMVWPVPGIHTTLDRK